MKKKLMLYAILAVAVLAGAYLFLFKSEQQEVKVETAIVKTGSIRNVITATGTIEPITQVEVGTQVSGVIKKIYVDYNAQVKKGQLIAELDKTTLQAALTEAKANLNSARNELDYQQKNFDRINQLYQTKVMSQTDFEEAQYKLNNAKAALEQRSSEVKRARTNLSYASIYSPIDGVVLSKAVDEGQTVAASLNTPTLFTIAQDLTKMQVEAKVDEADIGQVKSGQPVTFTVDAYPDDSFTGTVTQVRKEPTTESNVVTYTVIVQANNPEGKLMPGLTASITITTREVTNVLTVAAKALRFEPNPETMQAYLEGLDQKDRRNQLAGNGPESNGVQLIRASNQPVPPVAQSGTKSHTVWVKQGALIQLVEVQTGLTDGITVQITEGLQAGDQVVLAMQIASPASADSQTASTSRSPFMPKMPGRSNSKTPPPPPGS